MEKSWLTDFELWLDPLYWVYTIASYLWSAFWCAVVPETCA